MSDMLGMSYICLAQRSSIEKMDTGPKVGFVRQNLEKLEKLKNAILAKDINTIIRERADKECGQILEAIMQGKVTPPHLDLLPGSVDPLLEVILGKGYCYRSPIASTAPSQAAMAPSPAWVGTTASSTSSAPVTTVPPPRKSSLEAQQKMEALMKQMAEMEAREQERVERLAQLEEENQRRAAKEKTHQQEIARLKKLTEGLEEGSGGGGGSQLQLQLPSTIRGRGQAGVDITEVIQMVSSLQEQVSTVTTHVELLSEGQKPSANKPKKETPQEQAARQQLFED